MLILPRLKEFVILKSFGVIVTIRISLFKQFVSSDGYSNFLVHALSVMYAMLLNTKIG